MKKLLFIISLLFTNAYAEDFTVYTKFGIGYIIDQPKNINSPDTGEIHTTLYEDSNLSYHIERGLIVQDYRVGAYWTDFINQKDKEKHRPYKFEVFIDRYWDTDYIDFKIGTGFKLAYQTTIYFEKDGQEQKCQTSRNNILDRFSARVGFHKTYKNYVFSLEHHSHWLYGKPINNYWEYHKTEFNVAYQF